MKLFDLSHVLNSESPVFPGMNKPQFIPAATFDKNGYRETHLSFDSHTGTHMDAPAHMLENGKTLDQLPLDVFTGKALIIPVPENTELIEKDFLIQFEEKLSDVDFVLLKTGWSKYWGTPRYFENFPTLASEAVKWLLKFSLKGIGFDVISADPIDSTSFSNHFSLLSNELIIIENLNFPKELTENEGQFFCFPLAYENADGSPARTVLGVLHE